MAETGNRILTVTASRCGGLRFDCYIQGMIQLVPVASVISAYQKPEATVDTSNHAQTDIWASRLNVSRETLLEAAEQVGPSVAALRRYLSK